VCFFRISTCAVGGVALKKEGDREHFSEKNWNTTRVCPLDSRGGSKMTPQSTPPKKVTFSDFSGFLRKPPENGSFPSRFKGRFFSTFSEKIAKTLTFPQMSAQGDIYRYHDRIWTLPNSHPKCLSTHTRIKRDVSVRTVTLLAQVRLLHFCTTRPSVVPQKCGHIAGDTPSPRAVQKLFSK
jgi:hypothetical protein